MNTLNINPIPLTGQNRIQFKQLDPSIDGEVEESVTKDCGEQEWYNEQDLQTII